MTHPYKIVSVQHFLPALAGFAICFHPSEAQANPQGMTVSGGTAQAHSQGNQLTIQTSANAFLNWNSFNIGKNETTTFLQPGAKSVVWNQINDRNPSEILGHLDANGYVVLYNQNGFYFGKDSIITTGGFIASTAPFTTPSSMGGNWTFQGPPPAASIINYGEIKVNSGGSLFMIAEKVVNNGILSSPDGNIGLYAGKEVSISARPDGRGLSAKVTLPSGSVDNTGKMIADAGTIAVNARVVNQSGLIQANSVRNINGIVELLASQDIHLQEGSIIEAKGGSGISAAGTVLIKADGSYSDSSVSTINVSGGTTGGNGGKVEVSAVSMDAIRSTISGAAKSGWLGGNLLIDPTDIILNSNGTGTAPGGAVDHATGTGTLRLNVNSAFVGFSHITLQAERDITLAASTQWDLNASTGIKAPGSILSLEAGRNINFANNSRLFSSIGGWSVALAAGADFTSHLHVAPGVGGIYLNGGPINGSSKPNGSGSLELTGGNITLKAGQEVSVGSGDIRTTGLGAIQITAVNGDVDAGKKTENFIFNRNGASPSPNGVGGIAVLGSGNLDIIAGEDILSVLPLTGSYGSGNVTLSAAGRIIGRYLVNSGIGSINAGSDVGSSASPLSLALIKGNWEAHSLKNIFLNEVYNPNGSLNPNKLSTGSKLAFAFDYSPDSIVKLFAGDSVQLLGDSVTKTQDNVDRPPIYPPQLEITAGKGGVILGNDVVLFPSPKTNLKITTTEGGDFRSTDGHSYQMVLSDSADPNYTSFILSHSVQPMQLAYANIPATLNIAGDVENVRLQIPKMGKVNIAGDALNFFYTGQNLLASDVTEINIGGEYKSRGDRTGLFVGNQIDLSIFDPHTTISPELGAKISYNPLNGQLVFQGKMTVDERNFLLHPMVKATDFAGNVLLDINGLPLLVAANFASASTVNSLFDKTQDVPAFPTQNGGIFIGGPGKLSVSAKKMDLGITAGIRSVVTALNPNLARYGNKGASIQITLTGDLDMTSSQISSFDGGDISILSGGKLSIGSQEQFTSDDTPKGIYTGHGGSLSVTAAGDINIKGSRIATYDGGNITVNSQNGSIDAGEGAKGFFSIVTQQYNPVTHQIENRNDRFFGSGIIALTRQDSFTTVGDITVKAKQDIKANSGGILQLAFNSSDRSKAKVSLDAGRNIEANQSGVLGANVNLKAGGDIAGLVIANQNLNIDARQNISVTAVASGGVSISGGGSVSGTIVGGGSVNVSGDSISASVISASGNASTSGDSSAAKVGGFNGVAAPAAQQTGTDTEKAVEKATKPEDLEDPTKKKGMAKGPVLSKSTGRVTVILPNTK